MAMLVDPRIREDSGDGPGGSCWWMAERLPARPLRPYLQGYADYLEAEPRPFRRRHEPSGYVTFILNFAEPIQVEMPGTGVHLAAPAFVAGLHQTWAQTDSSGVSRGLQLNITPLAARAVLGVRMSALSGDVVDLCDLIGTAGRVLLEQLEAAPDSAARFDLLDETIERALGRTDEPPPLVAEAWRRLQASHGAEGIAALAEDLGCSRKTLHASFDEHIGLPPKTVARIFRFQHAAEQVGRAPWSVIATDSGYYDQSHLIRDFRQFAGMTPLEYARRRASNGGTLDVVPLTVEPEG